MAERKLTPEQRMELRDFYLAGEVWADLKHHVTGITEEQCDEMIQSAVARGRRKWSEAENSARTRTGEVARPGGAPEINLLATPFYLARNIARVGRLGFNRARGMFRS